MVATAYDFALQCAESIVNDYHSPDNKFKGHWHNVPTSESVWEGSWLPGYHFQVADRGRAGQCHPIFVKCENIKSRIEKRVAVDVAKKLISRGIPVVAVWEVTKDNRKLVYGSVMSDKFPNHLPYKFGNTPEIVVPTKTPKGVGDCFYPITTHDPGVNHFTGFMVTRDEKKVPSMIEAMALKGIPVAGVVRVTEDGQRIDFRSLTVPVIGYVPEISYNGDYGSW